MDLVCILDRENLTERQISSLVSDIIVGDAKKEDFNSIIKTHPNSKISTNAQLVLERADNNSPR